MSYDSIKQNVESYTEKKEDFDKNYAEFNKEYSEFKDSLPFLLALDDDITRNIANIANNFEEGNESFLNEQNELNSEKEKNVDVIYEKLSKISDAKSKLNTVLGQKYGKNTKKSIDTSNEYMDKYNNLLLALETVDDSGSVSDTDYDFNTISFDASLSDKDTQKDDNGKVYQKDNSLLPDCCYSLNGYVYNTDSNGRIISAQGKLQKKDHDHRKAISVNISDVGKGSQRFSDDRGHLIADMFNGSNGLGNMVAMDSWINQHGDYRKLENILFNAVNTNHDVYFSVMPVYDGNSHRPSKFRIMYSIDGDKMYKCFDNG